MRLVLWRCDVILLRRRTHGRSLLVAPRRNFTGRRHIHRSRGIEWLRIEGLCWSGTRLFVAHPPFSRDGVVIRGRKFDRSRPWSDGKRLRGVLGRGGGRWRGCIRLSGGTLVGLGGRGSGGLSGRQRLDTVPPTRLAACGMTRGCQWCRSGSDAWCRAAGSRGGGARGRTPAGGVWSRRIVAHLA